MQTNIKLKDSRTFEKFYSLCTEAYGGLGKLLTEAGKYCPQDEEYFNCAGSAKKHLSLAAAQLDELRKMHDLFGSSEAERQNTAKNFYLNISVAKDFIFSIIKNSPYDFGNSRISKLEKCIKNVERYIVEKKHNVVMMRPATLNQSAEAGGIMYKGRRRINIETARKRIRQKAGEDEPGQER